MLAIWEYFWIEADWGGAPPASVSAADAVVPKFGSKGNDYYPLPDLFWETRERYLARYVEPVVKQSLKTVAPVLPPEEKQAASLITKATIAQAKLRALQSERDTLLERARLATTREDLQRHSARVIQLSLDILKTNDQYYEQAAIILLLDIY